MRAGHFLVTSVQATHSSLPGISSVYACNGVCMHSPIVRHLAPTRARLHLIIIIPNHVCGKLSGHWSAAAAAAALLLLRLLAAARSCAACCLWQTLLASVLLAVDSDDPALLFIIWVVCSSVKFL